jgi:probable rRNA maturation factor
VSIEVANESGVAVDESALASVARHVLAAMRVNPAAELSIMVVTTEVMTELHERWMDEPGPTDVMAFPMDELVDESRRPDAPEIGPALLGDVVLCPAFAAAQARKAGHGLGDELALLTVHGVLHLLGYDHGEPGAGARDVRPAERAARGVAVGPARGRRTGGSASPRLAAARHRRPRGLLTGDPMNP